MSNELQIVGPDGQAVARREEQPASLLQVIAGAASDPRVDVAKMEQLLGMQERLARRDAEVQFNAAMARLQPRLPRILKRGKIEFRGTSQPYARYEDIDEAIRPLLAAEGFAITFGTGPAPNSGGIQVTATLAHVAGHSRTESIALPYDTSGSKNSIQAVGSATSYGKRYLTGMMLNIVTVGEDDDANKFSCIDERQQNTILDMFAAADMDPASESKFKEWMGVKELGDIRKIDYEKAMRALRTKVQQRQARG